MILSCSPVVNTSGDKEFIPEKLTVCSKYKIFEDQPVFSGVIEEGDIAYYGLLLQVNYDKKIVNYLRASEQNSLWAYHRGYGPTSEDSAIVIEGLLSAGLDKRILEKNMEVIIKEYYDSSVPGFHTVRNGNAPYWSGVKTETTAHLSYLLYEISGNKYIKIINETMLYLANLQKSDGSWDGNWFPSFTIPMYYIVRLLHLDFNKYKKNIEYAKDYLIKAQLDNGSWNNSIIETAAAILTLKTLRYFNGENNIRKGRLWIDKNRIGNSWNGETVLYYWTESASEKTKIFYICNDKGKITQAWAKLALRH